MSKIDWRNHFVAFLSALLGIFIAFQLENWREGRIERERVSYCCQVFRPDRN